MPGNKRIRTVLYGDQRFSSGELELLHTPAMQRLYDLHQLGLTDRVYVDASHSRLQHVLGVVEQADRLMQAISRNLSRESDRPQLQFGPIDNIKLIATNRLATYVEMRRPVARLMGLLHDLTHAPYGHTLEDEIQLSKSKHDSPDRQAEMFYRLLCQFFAWLYTDTHLPKPRAAGPHSSPTLPLRDPELDSVDLELRRYLDGVDLLPPPQDAGAVARLVVQSINEGLLAARFSHSVGPQELKAFLKDLHLAMSALLRLELLHKAGSKLKKEHIPIAGKYPFQHLIEQVLADTGTPILPEDHFNPHRDAFLLDVIGNTICADLLDYAKRDALYCGLNLDYDADRIIEQFTIVSEPFHRRTMPESVGDDPFAGHSLRPAISIFTHKLRVDVPGQLMGLLQARFHVYERALFHPTKCIAGAMLGCGLQLVGLSSLPEHMRHIGDQVFLHQVSEASRLVRDLLREYSVSYDVFGTELRDRVVDRLGLIPLTGVTVSARALVADLHDARADEPLSLALNSLDAGILILDRLASRRYFKPAFRLLPNDKLRKAKPYNEGDKQLHPAEIVADVFTKETHRFQAERLIEEAAGLPQGTVAIHCPPFSGPTKVAAVLLMARGDDGVEQLCSLREIGSIANGIFSKHEEGVLALEEMYRATWRLVVSVAPPYHTNHDHLSQVISQVLTEYLVNTTQRFYSGLEVPNDANMLRELRESSSAAAAQEEFGEPIVEHNTRDLAKVILSQLANVVPSIKDRLSRPPTDPNANEDWQRELQLFLSQAANKTPAPQEGSQPLTDAGAASSEQAEHPLTAAQVVEVFTNYKIDPSDRSKIVGVHVPAFVKRANQRPERLREVRALLKEFAIPDVIGMFNQLKADHVAGRFNDIIEKAWKDGPRKKR